jgi:hypothetical protein
VRSVAKILMAGVLALLAVGAGGAIASVGAGGVRASDMDRHGYPHAEAGSGQSPAVRHMDSSRFSQVAYLTGLAEIDEQGEEDAGDPDAKGSANLLQIDERTVCYGFMIQGAETPTAVHVHKGLAGQNGPIVLPFDNVPKDETGAPAGDPGASSGCKEVKTQEEAEALRRIRRNPGNYYVNIHTTSFPDGAVRGQLGPVLFENEG